MPGRGAIVVTFNAGLTQPEAGCTKVGYAYREYTTDMVPTGNAGVFSCHATIDTGGVFAGNHFYLASAEVPSDHGGLDGWQVAKYNAVTWTRSASLFQPMAPGEFGGDPMVAWVNGHIDVSAWYAPGVQPGPFVTAATFHDFFTPDLHFVGKRILSDTPHGNLSSLVVAGGVINFVTGTAILGDVIVMQYDSNWNYLGTKTLKEYAAAPEGAAFDGKRFYVTYLDVPCTDYPCYDNVRLAAFDSNWNLLDDIAVTNFTAQETIPNRPSLALWKDRIYVGYDEYDDKTPNLPPDQAEIGAYVKVYDVSGK